MYPIPGDPPAAGAARGGAVGAPAARPGGIAFMKTAIGKCALLAARSSRCLLQSSPRNGPSADRHRRALARRLHLRRLLGHAAERLLSPAPDHGLGDPPARHPGIKFSEGHAGSMKRGPPRSSRARREKQAGTPRSRRGLATSWGARPGRAKWASRSPTCSTDSWRAQNCQSRPKIGKMPSCSCVDCTLARRSHE